MSILKFTRRQTSLKSFHIIAFFALILVSISSVWAVEPAVDLGDVKISNIFHPKAQVFASSQPSQDDLSDVAKAGIQVVVNLRPHNEQDWNEQEIVEALGMRYINLPVAGAAGITTENAKKLEVILAELEGKQVLVHCSSSNRVGALNSLISFQQNGGDMEAAINDGKKWGLTKLEPLVREKLSQ